MIRFKWYRKFIWKLDEALHCRIHWICDAAEDAVWWLCK